MATSKPAILPLLSPMCEVLKSASDLISLSSGFSCVALRYMLIALLSGVHRNGETAWMIVIPSVMTLRVEGSSFHFICNSSVRVNVTLNVTLTFMGPCILRIFQYIYLTRCNTTQFIVSGNCSTCFGWYHHPSSGAHTTVCTASVNCHTVTATCRLDIYFRIFNVTSFVYLERSH
jgi:hypothetical protein